MTSHLFGPEQYDFRRHPEVLEIIDNALQNVRNSILTKREVQILSMMLRGHSNISISLILNITEGTVKIHRKNSYRKLEISSQIELFLLILDFTVRMPGATPEPLAA